MFSKTGPTITSRRATSLVQTNAGEILDSHSDLRCRRWHPAKLRGRSVSSAFPCISFHKRAEGTAGAFQRGKISGITGLNCSIRKRISRKLICELRTHKSDNAQPAWVISRNQSTIASGSEHRQPVFLHPRTGAPEVERSCTILELGTAAEMEFARGACRFCVEPLDYRFPNSFRFRRCLEFAIVFVVQVLVILILATLKFSQF
jgi:hypothetical protein